MDGGIIFAWGNNELGQLTRAGSDFEASVVADPRPAEALNSHGITHLAPGPYAVAGISDTGLAYLWGDDGDGSASTTSVTPPQGDGAGDGGIPRPVAALEAFTIADICLGGEHTLILTDTGRVVTLGDGSSGQRGLTTPKPRDRPAMVKGALKDATVIGIAAGERYSIALTSQSEVFGWGDGGFGQLGNGHTDVRPEPVPMALPFGLPVHSVVCGDTHTVLLDVEGGVWTAGLNSYGQLGTLPVTSDGLGGTKGTRTKAFPHRVKALTDHRVVQVDCGAAFTVALTASGHCYTFGKNYCGALGDGTTKHTHRPRMVAGDLLGRRVAQVAAGSRFVLVLDSTGVVWGWGDNSSSQLGSAATAGATDEAGEAVDYAVLPVRVAGFGDGVWVDRLWVGPDYCFARAAAPGAPLDLSAPSPSASSSLPCITPGALERTLDACAGDNKRPLIRFLGDALGSVGALNASFLADDSGRLDAGAVAAFYANMYDGQGESVADALAAFVKRLVERLVRPADSLPDVCLNVYHVALLGLAPSRSLPATFRPTVAKLTSILADLAPGVRERFVEAFGAYPSDVFADVVETLQAFLSNHFGGQGWDGKLAPSFGAGCRALALFNEANDRQERATGAFIIPYQSFYNAEINTRLDLMPDYVRWRTNVASGTQMGARAFYFCMFPFLLSARSKSRILFAEALQTQGAHYQGAIHSTLRGRVDSPFLKLVVRREAALEDALNAITSQVHNIRKPIKVEFVGEEGEDAGGLTKELFALLVRRLFEPDLGIFRPLRTTTAVTPLAGGDGGGGGDGEANGGSPVAGPSSTDGGESAAGFPSEAVEEEVVVETYYFNPGSQASNEEFALVGMVLGLAMYNGVILDVRFPRVLYAMILGAEPTFADLCEAAPDLGRGLQALLDFDGDVEHTFFRSFVAEVQAFGETKEHPLVPGGEGIAVTNENRQYYVDSYVGWLLRDGFASQWESFKAGFLAVISTPCLSLFRPEELELAIVGTQVLDFARLRESTRYEGGYSDDHPTIELFWEVVLAMTPAEQKALLRFATGTDRAPMGGLQELPFIVQRVALDESLDSKSLRLPTSHTCFRCLLLPEYHDLDTMRDKLLTAIAHDEGFGMH